jgi:prolyl oligopeptidase
VTDEFAWLEEVTGDAALAWVAVRNAETLAALAHTDRFAAMRDAVKRLLDADDRIPWPAWRAEFFYDFWRDEAHPRGLWRRTTLEQYGQSMPQWEILVDVDALAADEGENWVWSDVELLKPDYELALISLSRGGSDAHVVREFDLRKKSFVDDGFRLPEAKSWVGWIDANCVYVGTDFGPGSLTSSGYPRIVKRWRRGTPLHEAELVFAGEESDVGAGASFDPTPGFARHFVTRSLDFWRSESYQLLESGRLIRVPIPEDAAWEVRREWIVIRLRSAWLGHPAGCLLATDFDRLMAGTAGFDRLTAGTAELTVLFAPDERTCLDSWIWTRSHLIIGLLSDVTSRLEALTPTGDGWRREPLADNNQIGHLAIVDTEPDLSDAYLSSSSGFLEPPTLHFGQIGSPRSVLKSEPPSFDTQGLTVRQFFAASADGTRVPYFVVGDPGKSPAPTWLTGYGGFENAQTPYYDRVVGRCWLERGGTYVVANIRGGGEYGPAWHHAAMRERRPRAYEDFAAVATDLVERGITTPARLGAEGGSNGGLLMGVMLTRYPTLFGAIVASVPLLDMRRYHRLLAGMSWVAEYGNPDDPADWAFLREYSPYHNIYAQRPYPPILFITSTRDDRVHPGHARKMTARLREFGYDVSYYENVEGGHGAASNNEQRAFVYALQAEFLWGNLS